ncbi:hypothetical protein ACS0TY_001299 [Phlomoides rotata]
MISTIKLNYILNQNFHHPKIAKIRGCAVRCICPSEPQGGIGANVKIKKNQNNIPPQT